MDMSDMEGMASMEQLPQRERRGRRRAEASHAPEGASDGEGGPCSTSTEQLSAHQQLSSCSTPQGAADSVQSELPQQPTMQTFEYLDHTADIQIHSWGRTLEGAFASAGLGMYNYMVPLEQLDASTSQEFHAEGHDMESLLFAFLDELLFTFHTEMLVCKQLCVTTLDRDNWKISATGHGEAFDRSKHEQGTEVKAITYSAMQIYEKPEQSNIYVIVDI